MPRLAFFHRLSPDDKEWFVAEARCRHYGDLEQLAKDLSRRTGQQIRKSAVGRFALALKRRDLTIDTSVVDFDLQNKILALGSALVDLIEFVQRRDKETRRDD